LNRLRITAAAQADIDILLLDGEETFGYETARRYRLLLDEALNRVRADPERVGAPSRLAPGSDLRIFPLRLARLRNRPADRIGRPRHVLVYRAVSDVVLLVRVLHESMDIPSHLSGG
jgi:plasmid stabilization system protein ParE